MSEAALLLLGLLLSRRREAAPPPAVSGGPLTGILRSLGNIFGPARGDVAGSPSRSAIVGGEAPPSDPPPARARQAPLNEDRRARGGGTFAPSATARPTSGVAWAGLIFADADAWRTHVRPIYGPQLQFLGIETDTAVAARVRPLLAEEGETFARFAVLNATHCAFADAETQTFLLRQSTGGVARA